MKILKKVFFVFSFIVLALAMGIQIYARIKYHHEPSLANDELRKMIPKEYKGWVSQDVELTDWEKTILSQDQYINRNYVKQGVMVNIYVSYWTPGSVPYYHAGAHNPDSCWVNSGMDRVDRKYAQDMAINGESLKPFEYGCYVDKSGQKVDVIFWHLIGGTPMRYVEQKLGWNSGLQGRIDRIPMYVQDFKDYGLDQKREQFFIRIYSNIPFFDWKEHPEIYDLLEILKPCGIFNQSPVTQK